MSTMAGIRVKRPLSYTIICIHSWIPVVLNFIIAFSPDIKKAGQFYPVVYCLIDCLLFISLIGAWYMKRWGVELYIAALSCYCILLLFLDRLDKITELSIAAYSFYSGLLFILFSLFFYRKMDRNL